MKFYREGAEIQSSADFRVLQEGDLHSLLIGEAFPEDSGTYSVKATNSSGRATSSAELLVQGELTVIYESQLAQLSLWKTRQRPVKQKKKNSNLYSIHDGSQLVYAV